MHSNPFRGAAMSRHQSDLSAVNAWRGMLRPVAGLTIAVAALLGVCGCDDSDGLSGDDFRIEPASIALSQAETTIALAAHGGEEPLTWTVSDASLGSVTAEGRVVNYTRTAANGINTVRVADPRGWQAQAFITQQDGPAAATALTISPATATLAKNGDKAVFTAAGGVPAYSWSLGAGGRGTLQVSGKTQAVYTRTSAGDNTVVVTDRAGNAAVATITQANSTTPTINPGTATLGVNGETARFTATGGVAPYTWSVTDGARGSVVSTTEDSAVYRRNQPGSNILKVRDSVGASAQIIVLQP